MDVGPIIGELSIVYQSKDITWNFPNFRELPEDLDFAVESPPFACCDAMWRLRIYPNGKTGQDNEGRVGLALVREQTREPEHRVMYTIGIIRHDGETHEEFAVQHTFNENNLERGTFLFGSRSALQAQTIGANGQLSAFCRMRIDAGAPARSRIQVAGPNAGFARMQRDFLKLLRSGIHSDVQLNVQGAEFRAHKAILRARSPVFSSLLADDLPGRSTAIVTVEDCDSDTFPDFLEYLYTGRAEALSAANAISLYSTADAYEVTDLRADCLACMTRSLSVDTFCDVMELALQRGERGLNDAATRFFVKNVERIIVTARWLQFLGKNIATANSLFIAALTRR